MFIKIKVLKSQGVKCRCTYGVTLPREYLQVARWWQRWCFCIRCYTTWSSLGTSSPTSTCADFTYRLRHSILHRARHSNFSVPTKETIQVYSHLGTHATPAVNSSKLKIVTMTYECSEPSSDTLPANCSVCHLLCPHPASASTTDSSREPLETKHKKL